jgi:LysM repeat protein
VTISEIRNGEIELDAANLIITKKGMYAKIEKLRGDLNSANKENISADLKSDLDKALLSLNAAETSLEQNYIEDADMRIKEAETLITGANTKMKEKNALAAIAKAEKLLVQAKERDSAGRHSENLGKAENLIDDGKDNIKNKKYNEGISNAEEAETLIAAVLNTMDSETVDAKLKASAEEQKEDVTEEDTSSKKEQVKEDTKPAGNVYTVQWRKKNTDCLWRIAQKVYKDAAYWPAIYIANRDQIKDPDLIFPGQKFVIPPKPQKRPSYKKIIEEEKTKEQEKEKAVGEDKTADKESKEPVENK